jgi:hypothetical protein
MSENTNTISAERPAPAVTPLERARRRVRIALREAEDGPLDLDTMDIVCTQLTNALVDLDEAERGAE